MTVCIRPLFFGHRVGISLVEFIEFYRIIGADKFFFYNYFIETEDRQILKYYEDIGVVEVFHWTLPDKELVVCTEVRE